MNKIKELKQLLKEKASYIHNEREAARGFKREGDGLNAHHIHNRLSYINGPDYRCYHIAYCELRGRSREQIEKPRENNLPNQYKIDQIKKQYAWTQEEINAFEERKAKHEVICVGQN